MLQNRGHGSGKWRPVAGFNQATVEAHRPALSVLHQPGCVEHLPSAAAQRG